MQVKRVWKIHKITKEQWETEFNCDNIKLTSNLDELVNSFNTELPCTLDELAPEVETKLSLKPKHPWYCLEIKQQKAKVRRHEKRWLKHNLDSLWLAYKKEGTNIMPCLNARRQNAIGTKWMNARETHTSSTN